MHLQLPIPKQQHLVPILQLSLSHSSFLKQIHDPPICVGLSDVPIFKVNHEVPIFKLLLSELARSCFNHVLVPPDYFAVSLLL